MVRSIVVKDHSRPEKIGTPESSNLPASVSTSVQYRPFVQSVTLPKQERLLEWKLGEDGDEGGAVSRYQPV